MSDNLNSDHEDNGCADSMAATAIISLVVLGLYLWLSGMPM